MVSFNVFHLFPSIPLESITLVQDSSSGCASIDPFQVEDLVTLAALVFQQLKRFILFSNKGASLGFLPVPPFI